jgi:DNA-binding NtrC family response regulator
MEPLSLLLVDDEIEFLETLGERLRKRGYRVTTANSGQEALAHLQDKFDVMVLDQAMPGLSGLDVLDKAKQIQPTLEIIMLTGKAGIESAVKSLKHGAFQYLAKPCEIEELVVNIENAGIRKRDNDKKILEIRMQPFLTEEKRRALIASVLATDKPA